MRKLRADCIDLTGQAINRISVLGSLGVGGNDTEWWCECHCGKFFRARGRRLREARIRSCGCVPWREPSNKTHGEGRFSKNHSVEYDLWCGIKNRTSNLKVNGARNYAGRGIGMYQPWRESFPMFLEYLGRRPSREYSIGRIDNDKGYEPGNVEWQTLEQQANNKRSNRFVEVDGERHTIAQWSRILGVKAATLYAVYDDVRIQKKIRERLAFVMSITTAAA
jgi:hypothetical protein